MSLRRTAATVLTTALTSTAFLAVSAPAADASPGADRTDRAARGCVSKPEYRKAKKGMTQARVHKIFGTSGKQVTKMDLPDGGYVVGRAYKVCTSKKGALGVSYVVKPGKKPVLAEKAVVWR